MIFQIMNRATTDITNELIASNGALTVGNYSSGTNDKENIMNKRTGRRVDKTKKSNIKCEHCEQFGMPKKNTYDDTFCKLTGQPKKYWNRCKQFNWAEDI